MARTETRPWDAAEHIATDADAAYLGAALDEGDAELVAAALDDIARAKGLPADGRSRGLHQPRT